MAAKQKRKETHAPSAAGELKPRQKKPAQQLSTGNNLVRNLSIILFALSFILYYNSLSSGWALDDYGVIKEIPFVQQGFSGIDEILATGYRTGLTTADNDLYRPLSKVAFAIEWWISPDSPGIHHFFNVLLFSLSVVLLFRMLRLYISNSMLIPFLASALFALHPLHTEVVANIKGRDDILCFLFFTLAAIQFHRFIATNRNKHLYYGAIMFFLSFLSKESAITFAAVIPLMVWFFVPDFDRRKFFSIGGSLAIVTIVFLGIRAIVLNGVSGGIPVVDNYIAGIESPLTQRTTAIFIGGIYLIKMIFPYELVCDQSLNELPVTGAGDWQFLLSFAAFLGIGVFALLRLRQKHILSFSILYFLITFSLVSNVIMLIGTNYGERLLYAPSLGICIAIAWIAQNYIQREESVTSDVSSFFKRNSKAMILLAVFAVPYSGLTIIRNYEWENNDTLYATDKLKAPESAKLRFYYANEITQSNRLDLYKKGSSERLKIVDSALIDFRKAMEIYPGYGLAAQKLGEMYFEKGMNDSADFWYKHAIKVNPAQAMIRNNYGRFLFSTSRMEEADFQFTMALKLNPGYADALNNKAGSLGMKAGAYVVLAQKYPVGAATWSERARTLFNQSLEYSLKAIAYSPDYIQAYETTALTYTNLGDQVNAAKYRNLANEARKRNGK
jgi:tetratricopeptide (TPR) repeat protein